MGPRIFRGAVLEMGAALLVIGAPQEFTAAVYNYAGASKPVVTQAVEAARRAFLAAGVDSQWRVCQPEGCVQPPPAEGLYLQLFLMPRMRAAVSDVVAGHPAGFAIVDVFSPRPRGYAFYDAVNEVADRTTRPLYAVLACVLAHESGHLLGLEHQPHGVMRPGLEPYEMDRVLSGRAFTVKEQKLLRAALSGGNNRLLASSQRRRAALPRASRTALAAAVPAPVP
jgi:hypothetical protein